MIAQTMTSRARDPESVALFRIVATEAYRFPELAAKMRESSKQRWDSVVANYFRGQVARGTLTLIRRCVRCITRGCRRTRSTRLPGNSNADLVP